MTALRVALAAVLLAAPAVLAFGHTQYPDPSGDHDVIQAAKDLYGTQNLRVYPAHVHHFYGTFPDLGLFLVVELGRDAPEEHLMVYDWLVDKAWDATGGYNLLRTTQTPTTSASALSFGKSFADVANFELLRHRHVLESSDSTWVGMTVADPAAAAIVGGWRVTLTTWADYNGLVLNWTIDFVSGKLTEGKAVVVRTHAGSSEHEWLTPLFRVGDELKNLYGAAHVLEAKRGGNALMLPADVLSASYVPQAWDYNFDETTWMVKSQGVLDTGLVADLLTSAKQAYRHVVERNTDHPWCSSISNPNVSFRFFLRDPDCELELRVVSANSLLCGACLPVGNTTRFWIQEDLAESLNYLGWYGNSTLYNRTEILTGVIESLLFRHTRTRETGIPLTIEKTNFTHGIASPDRRLDVRHPAMSLYTDPAFARVGGYFSSFDTYLGIAPAWNGSRELRAYFSSSYGGEDVSPWLPVDWTLSTAVAGQADLLWTCSGSIPEESLVSQPFTGIGPGTKLLIPAIPASGPPCDTTLCTTNFIWSDGTEPGEQGSNFYVGTAGHCTGGNLPAGSSRTRTVCIRECLFGGFSGGYYSGIGLLLEVVYSRDDGDVDFALLKIPPANWSEIRFVVPFWGGPTGVACPGGAYVDTEDSYHVPYGELTAVAVYGHSNGLGETPASRARAGLHDSCSSSGWFRATIPVAPGDSGSGFLLLEGDSGQGAENKLIGRPAYGVVKGYPVDDFGAGLVNGPSIPNILSRLGENLGWADGIGKTMYLVCPDQTGSGGHVCS